jgi:GDP-L-fucose synthase
MKTLLTGANGLVGSTIDADVKVCGRNHCIPDYKEYNRRWVDLTRWDKTLNLFQETKPTHVVHCAARVGGLAANINHMGEFFYENMMINLNVLEAARRVGTKKVVSFMSTCIFPDDIEYPMTEDKLHLGEPHPSNYGYSYAKRMVDVQSRAYNEQYGLSVEGSQVSFNGRYVTVVPTNIYGPNDNFELQNSHVLPALIHKCYLAKTQNTPFVVWGSGKPLREFIYSEDVGELTQIILEEYEGSMPIILSTSQEHSIKEVASIIAEAMEFQGPIIFDDMKPDGQYRKPTCNDRLKSIVPDYPFTPLEEGIKKTVEWFVNNYEACRK